MGEEVEEYWEDNENVAIVDFLDDVDRPYSCSQWGSVGNPDLPIIINDGDYDFHDQFYDIYPTNVFIDHEMRVHAILDTAETNVESINEKIQEMLNNIETELSANYKNITQYYKHFLTSDSDKSRCVPKYMIRAFRNIKKTEIDFVTAEIRLVGVRSGDFKNRFFCEVILQ